MMMDVALDSIVAPDDSVFLLGGAYLPDQEQIDRPADAIVARIRPDGTPDPGFGAAGIASISHNAYVYEGRVIVQPDGKVVALILNGERLVRFQRNGALDTR
jgi:hypothetical protein